MSNADYPAFPPGFVLGAATAAYQIEGGVREGGRGESIWDRFSHTPGKTYEGHTGDVACDHYHRWRQDIALMAELGLHAYRFSVAWPRIYPQGSGSVNPAGLDFYDRLVDALLEQDIQPFVTLYHWDLPQALEDAGGWPNRDLVGYFADYAGTVAQRLGDRVRYWATLNEPWVSAFVGYLEGRHAPGQTDFGAALQAAHTMLVAHGKGYDAIQSASRVESQAGIVLNLGHVEPVTDRQEDLDAMQRYDGYLNRWFLDPLFHGRYPEDMIDLWRGFVPDIEPDDLAGLPERVDLLGINNYFRTLVGSGPHTPASVSVHKPDGAIYTEMDWEVYPDGLYELLTRVHRDFGPSAIYITENGAAFSDTLQPGGVVDDPQRVEYYQSHVDAAWRAVEDGVPLRGYFAWSLLDNYEWAYGYSKRFGIVYVDYPTQARFIKNSGRWYQRLIAAQ